jgi:hypothetical protein
MSSRKLICKCAKETNETQHTKNEEPLSYISPDNIFTIISLSLLYPYLSGKVLLLAEGKLCPRLDKRYLGGQS